MEHGVDTKGQPYVEWVIGHNGMAAIRKRAWVQHRVGDADWSGAGRYINVARVDHVSGRLAMPVDFPLHTAIPDADALRIFVGSIISLTGSTVEGSHNA